MARTLTKEAAGSNRLAEKLAGFDDQRLEALLAARPDLATPAPGDLAHLANRAGSWTSVYACYRGLDQWCQQVVQALCLVAGSTSVAGLARLLGLDAADPDLARALDLLVDRALLVRDGASLELVPAFEELPYPAGLAPSVRQLVGLRSVAQLTAMVKHLGITAGTTKASVLDALAAALVDPQRVRDAARRGPAGTAKLLADVAEQGPVAYVPTVTYGASAADRTPVGWLLNRGLLVAHSWNTVILPGEVGLALRGGRPFPVLAVRPPPLRPLAIGADVVDSAAAEAALRLVADVASILDDWSSAPPKLLKAGGVGTRELRRAAKAVGRTEQETARIVDLAAGAGLVVADLVTGSGLPTARYDEWLDLDVCGRWRELMAAWLAGPFHVGLAGVLDTRDKVIPPLLERVPHPDARRQRRVVLSALSSLEPGGAPPADELLAWAQWQAPLLWSSGPGTPGMMTEWVVQEAELVGLAAQRALATTGRLAAEGRLDEAVQAQGGFAPPVSSSFVVQADLTVVAPGELAGPVRAELELLADVESTGAATVYRLSEASLRRGFDAGRTSEGILDFLDRHASRQVPQSLRYLVADLGRRFGKVRVGTAGCYVRCDDASLLAEVVRSRGASRLGLRMLAPTVAVTDADPDTVVRTFREAGHLPAQEDAKGDVVLVRPQRRRAAPRLRPSLPAAGPSDLASVVAALRRAPRPKAPAKTARPAPPPPPPLPAPQMDMFEFDARPVDIAKGQEEVTELLSQAFMEDWVVRMAYTNGKGRSTQLNVIVLESPGQDVIVEVLPGANTRTLVLDRIEWARVMTEAEEDLLYL